MSKDPGLKHLLCQVLQSEFESTSVTFKNSDRKNQMTLNMITKLDFFRGNSLISGTLFELFSEPDDNGIHEEFMKISEKNSRQKNS